MHPLALILAQETDTVTDACGPADEASYLCRQVFEATDSEFWAKTADFVVAKPLQIAIVVLVAWVAVRLVRRGIRRFVEHAKDDVFQQRVNDLRRRTGVSYIDTGPVVSARRAQRAEAIGNVLRSVTAMVIYSIAGIMVLGELGIDLGPLIAGAGIVGVALGFGAQSLVKDFLSGFFLLVEDQFGVGDIIDVDGTAGQVEVVSLRSTKLRDLNGTLWNIPNGEMVKVGNMSQKWARALLDIEVAYDTDIDIAREVIKRTADEMWQDDDYFRRIILEEPEIWGVQTLGANGIAIRLVVKTRPLEQWPVERELRRRIKRAFDDEGIEIPFPQRVVWMRADTGDGEGPVAAPPPAAASTTKPKPKATTRRRARKRAVDEGPPKGEYTKEQRAIDPDAPDAPGAPSAPSTPDAQVDPDADPR